MTPMRPTVAQKSKQMEIVYVGRCRECHDSGLVLLPGKQLENFSEEEIFSKSVPCSCEAGRIFRVDFAIRGDRCDAPRCSNPARHGADRGKPVKWCDIHQLEAVDVWRAGISERGGVAGRDLWRWAVRKVLKVGGGA